MEAVDINPFGNVFGGGITEEATNEFVNDYIEAEVIKESTIDLDPVAYFFERVASFGVKKSKDAVSGILDKIFSAIGTVASSVVTIIGQAVKVAIFKFGIELCAMAIKSLVESMTKMSLTPPSIDTKGVYYNFNQTATPTGSQSNNSGYGTSRPTFDNPFANPFSPF